MPLVSNVTIEFLSRGADRLVRDEDRVDKAISKTAKNAEKNEKKIGRWMERHKTALTTIGVAAAGAMAGVIAASPSLQAALSGVYLEFSMLAMDIGERWAPAFEWLEGIAGDIVEAWDKLPEPIKNFISYGLLAALVIGTIAGVVVGALWGLGLLNTALGASGLTGLLSGGLGLTTAAGGLTLLGAAVGVLSGLVLGGIVVWLLWKLGVLQAVEDAGAWFGWFARNTLTVLGNLKDNLFEWAGLVAANAGLWGSQFALNWVDGITKNIPFLGDALAPHIESLRTALDSAGVELQRRWDEWSTSGGFRDGLMEGMIVSTPTPNRTVSDTIGGLDSWIFGSGAGSGAGSTQADRLAEMFAGMPAVEIPGYSDSMQQLQDLQTQMETFETTADESMSQVSQSMATMATNASTSSQSVVSTTQTTTATVAATYDGLVTKAPVWGSDLMGRFIVGLNSQYPALLSAVARIRSTIESALSFDIATNDRAAMRWGSDLVEMFGTGMRQAMPMMAIPSPVPALAAAGGGGGGGTVYNITVPVEVQVNGAEARSFDERKIAVMVRDEIGQALRNRGR